MDEAISREKTELSAKRVLVIDDDQNIAELIEQALKEKSYEVELAFSGAAGLRLASEGTPDLIVLDVRLPDIDGMEVCQKLRQSGATMPILMLTGLDSVAEKVQGLQSGADDYLPKPFALEEFLARVRVLLRRR